MVKNRTMKDPESNEPSLKEGPIVFSVGDGVVSTAHDHWTYQVGVVALNGLAEYKAASLAVEGNRHYRSGPAKSKKPQTMVSSSAGPRISPGTVRRTYPRFCPTRSMMLMGKVGWAGVFRRAAPCGRAEYGRSGHKGRPCKFHPDWEKGRPSGFAKPSQAHLLSKLSITLCLRTGQRLQRGRDNRTNGFVAVEMVVDFAAVFRAAFQCFLANPTKGRQISVRVPHDQAGLMQGLQSPARTRIFTDGHEAERAGPEGAISVRVLH